jgi:hypothetical protein
MNNTGYKYESKSYVITNGYDPIDWSHPHPLNNKTDRFYIGYFGSLYKNRFLPVFFQIVKKLIDSNPEFSRKLTLRIVGPVENQIKDFIHKTIPKNNLVFTGYISYNETIKLLQQPQLLLLFIDKVPFNETITLGKIFDYLPTNNPVLGIGPLVSDTSKIIQSTRSGQMFDYEDSTGIESYILSMFKRWESNSLKLDTKDISLFDRRHLTNKLVNTFNHILEL